MASTVSSYAGLKLEVERVPHPFRDGQHVLVRIGENETLFLSRDEAAGLADGLIAATALPQVAA